MNSEYDIFINYWNQTTFIWAQITLGISVFVLILYPILLATKRTPSKKHDFISSSEIRYLWYSGLAFTISITFFLNYLIVDLFYTSSNFELIFKTIASVAMGFLVGYTINTYLNIYYPFTLEKRLHKIRFGKRISPKTGKEMVLLDEESEDVHLTKEMIEHERINAFEYDVWLDEESGYKIIEKYRGSLHLIVCDNCNYRTAHEMNEEILDEPSITQPGKLVKHYKCFYCEHQQSREAQIAPLETN